MNIRPIILIAVIGLAACTEDEVLSVTRGAQTFDDNCTICHGTDGTGAGLVAAELDPKPQNLTQLSARNGGVFPGTAVMNKIWRDTSDLHRSVMPDFYTLFEDDLLVPYDGGDGIETPTPLRLVELAEYLKTIQTP